METAGIYEIMQGWGVRCYVCSNAEVMDVRDEYDALYREGVSEGVKAAENALQRYLPGAIVQTNSLFSDWNGGFLARGGVGLLGVRFFVFKSEPEIDTWDENEPEIMWVDWDCLPTDEIPEVVKLGLIELADKMRCAYTAGAIQAGANPGYLE